MFHIALDKLLLLNTYHDLMPTSIIWEPLVFNPTQMVLIFSTLKTLSMSKCSKLAPQVCRPFIVLKHIGLFA